MDKSRDAFRTISEVADWLGTPTHVLRFWESRFTQIKPIKRAGGRRYYRPADMELLGGIKQLLHDDGMTIRGVQKLLREEGVRHVASLSQPVEDELMDAEVELEAEADAIDAGEEAPMAVDVPQEAEAPSDNVVPIMPPRETTAAPDTRPAAPEKGFSIQGDFLAEETQAAPIAPAADTGADAAVDGDELAEWMAPEPPVDTSDQDAPDQAAFDQATSDQDAQEQAASDEHSVDWDAQDDLAQTSDFEDGLSLDENAPAAEPLESAEALAPDDEPAPEETAAPPLSAKEIPADPSDDDDLPQSDYAALYALRRNKEATIDQEALAGIFSRLSQLRDRM
ncbi:MAG: DNA-binding transcriptional MerR regulator [Halocynthiibacter sp.]|jgi:DNA-binding transcriptional MerR regulator